MIATGQRLDKWEYRKEQNYQKRATKSLNFEEKKQKT